MELIPDDRAGASLEGAPASAWTCRVGPFRAAVWVDTSVFPHAMTSLAEGPAGRGEAWLRLDPTTLALQLNHIEGRIGSAEVTVHRNRPRLRRGDRMVTVTGPDLRWELTADGKRARLGDVIRSRELWVRGPEDRRVGDDCTPDEVAAVVLFDLVKLDQALGPNPFRYV